MNEVTYIHHNTHFSTPDEKIQQLYIETMENFGVKSHVIKFSYKENIDALEWVVITSLEPFESFSGAWTFKPYFSKMMDFAKEDDTQYNKCIDFLTDKTPEDLLKILYESTRIRP